MNIDFSRHLIIIICDFNFILYLLKQCMQFDIFLVTRNNPYSKTIYIFVTTLNNAQYYNLPFT